MKNEKGLPDRCEFFNVAQDDILGNEPRRANPPPVHQNRETFHYFIKDALPITELILSVLDTHLGLPDGTLASLQSQDQPSGTVIRMIRYPPRSSQDSGSALLGHTDIGTMTILCNVLGGLQILPPGVDDEESNWQYVKPEPECVIINLGDALVEWTGEILRSNKHRVTFPPGKQAECPRFSVAYLIRPAKNVSMKRLVGTFIPSAAEDGVEELAMNAGEWEMQKAMALKSGKDCSRSRGGRELGNTAIGLA